MLEAYDRRGRRAPAGSALGQDRAALSVAAERAFLASSKKAFGGRRFVGTPEERLKLATGAVVPGA
jgi:hypothetical protein